MNKLTLPARANLEHLRNEAKKLLKDMRRRSPDTKLATAQLELARSYGFESWRKLKSYIDALHDVGERLIQAVRTGDLEAMRSTLDRNPELVNAATDLEYRLRPSDTPAMHLIHLAVAEDQMEAARLLIERGADLNLRNADGRLPIHDCFELGRDEFAQLLLAAGAEADVCASAGYGMHDRLREILERDPAQANDLQTGLSPLGWSVYGTQPESARMLIEYGAVVNRPPYDVGAWGPASHVANTNLARVLLAHGADPNCRNEDGDTPMHAAVKSRLVRDPTEFVQILLASGADRTILNNDGRTALDEALGQVGKAAETYFPARPIAAKNLGRVIELLR
jgi:ankyrin repeat protein